MHLEYSGTPCIRALRVPLSAAECAEKQAGYALHSGRYKNSSYSTARIRAIGYTGESITKEEKVRNVNYQLEVELAQEWQTSLKLPHFATVVRTNNM